jgi:hypothetical protein
MTEEQVYKFRGKEFRFNDRVFVELCPGPIEKRSGRLVQVRKGCGQFGSDTYFIRLRDGSLCAFENAQMVRVDDKEFIKAYYLMNDMAPPDIPPQDVYPGESTDIPYTRGAGKYPAVGFIVDNPEDPETPGAFSMTITTSRVKDDEAAK